MAKIVKERPTSDKKLKSRKLSIRAKPIKKVEAVDKPVDEAKGKVKKKLKLPSKVKKASKNKASNTDNFLKGSEKTKMSILSETIRALDDPKKEDVKNTISTEKECKLLEGPEKTSPRSPENNDTAAKEITKKTKKKRKLSSDLQNVKTVGEAAKDEKPINSNNLHLAQATESKEVSNKAKQNKEVATENASSEVKEIGASSSVPEADAEKATCDESGSKTENLKCGPLTNTDNVEGDVSKKEKSAKKEKSKKRKKDVVSDSIECVDAGQTQKELPQPDKAGDGLKLKADLKSTDQTIASESKMSNETSASKKSKKQKLGADVEIEVTGDQPTNTDENWCMDQVHASEAKVNNKSSASKKSKKQKLGADVRSETRGDQPANADKKQRKSRDKVDTATLESAACEDVDKVVDKTDQLPRDDKGIGKAEKVDVDHVQTGVQKSRRFSEGDVAIFGSKRAVDNSNGHKRRQSMGVGSGEPFKRVRESDVVFRDNRLRDNSFHSKYDTFGERAHNDLSVVRGKGFRKEKTKKKRLNHHGGKLGFEVNSFKFPDDSD